MYLDHHPAKPMHPRAQTPRPTPDPYANLTPAPRIPRRTFTPPAPICPADPAIRAPATGHDPMTDILWLAALAGLFLLTLAYCRLCDEA